MVLIINKLQQLVLMIKINKLDLMNKFNQSDLINKISYQDLMSKNKDMFVEQGENLHLDDKLINALTAG